MLNRSLLCSNYHSAQTPIKSRDFFFIRKRRLTAAKAFAFGVVLMACSMAVAQGVDTKGDGNQSGPTFTITDCTSDGEICGGIIKRVAPLNIPGIPVGATMVAGGGPNLSGNIDASQGGQGPSAWGLATQYVHDRAQQTASSTPGRNVGWPILGAGIESGDPIGVILGLATLAGAPICSQGVMCGIVMPTGGLGRFPAGFGDKDFVMGLSIERDGNVVQARSLERFQNEVGLGGGKRLIQMPNMGGRDLFEQIRNTMDWSVDNGYTIRFKLDGYDYNWWASPENVLHPGELSVTDIEVRHLQAEWGRRFNAGNVVFYRKGIPGQRPPWMQ
jgi:hypothetical protein